MNYVCILRGGKNLKITDEVGKVWEFEDHPYCGPSVLDKKGDPASKQPPENSKFWIAVNQWYAQDKKVVDGMCQWKPERKMRIRHVVGRHYVYDGYEDD